MNPPNDTPPASPTGQTSFCRCCRKIFPLSQLEYHDAWEQICQTCLNGRYDERGNLRPSPPPPESQATPVSAEIPFPSPNPEARDLAYKLHSRHHLFLEDKVAIAEQAFASAVAARAPSPVAK